MNKKGFTLVELLATIIILSIVTGIAIVIIVSSFKKAKEDTEKVFIKNLEDAIEIYIDSIVSKEQAVVFDEKICTINKKINPSSKVYRASATVPLSDLSDPNKNPYSPLGKVVNPANEKVDCNPDNVPIKIYRDDDYVYYYFINKNTLNCLLDKTGYITNLPCECISDKSKVPRCSS